MPKKLYENGPAVSREKPKQGLMEELGEVGKANPGRSMEPRGYRSGAARMDIKKGIKSGGLGG